MGDVGLLRGCGGNGKSGRGKFRAQLGGGKCRAEQNCPDNIMSAEPAGARLNFPQSLGSLCPISNRPRLIRKCFSGQFKPQLLL